MYTLTNATIVTVDAQNHFYADGTIVIDDGRIIAVGNKEEIEPQGTVIDMGKKLLMPGLINAHTHTHSSIFRNMGDDLKLMDWLHTAMWPMERVLTSELACDATALSCVEYIRSGITTYADQFYFAKDIAPVAVQSGLRCFLAATVFENGCAETEDTLAAAVRFVEDWKHKNGRLYPCFGPHAPYSVSAEQISRVAQLAKKYGVLTHIHISETKDENNQIYEKYGCSPTKWLESLGLFENPVLAAHSIHLSDEDMKIYAENKAAAAYNPVSNLKLVSGIMPMKALMEHGITIAVGTDGAQSNNSMDLLRDARTGTLIQKQKEDDATFCPAETVVRMMTINGAAALGMEQEIGSLEEGKRADLITFDPGSPRAVPLHRKDLRHLYSAIAYSLCGADVVDNVVDGQWVMKERVIKTLPETEVLKNAQKASEYLHEALLSADAHPVD